MAYLISAESSMDLGYKYVKERNISYINNRFTIDDIEFVDDMGEDQLALKNFYTEISQSSLSYPKKITEGQYEEYFRYLLQSYDQILHICLGKGSSGSFENAIAVRDSVLEDFPGKNIVIIDSNCISTGYGLLVELACDMRDEGKPIEEIEMYLNLTLDSIQHYFFLLDTTYFNKKAKASGFEGKKSIFKFKPIFKAKLDGNITYVDRRLKLKSTIERIIELMLKDALEGENYNGKCFIGHVNSLDIAKDVKDQVLINFPMISDVKIFPMGATTASITGEGTIGIFFLGNKREE